jgi:hypothetical protein
MVTWDVMEDSWIMPLNMLKKMESPLNLNIHIHQELDVAKQKLDHSISQDIMMFKEDQHNN